MTPVVLVQRIRPAQIDRHRRWFDEVRARRAEFAASRRAVGITRQVYWAHPGERLTVVRVEGADPQGSIAALDAAAHSDFDRWYRACDREVHEAPFAAARPAELLADYAEAAVDPFDLFVASAIPLLPGRADEYRTLIDQSLASSAGRRRLERWNLSRMSIWLHRAAVPPGEVGTDIVVYELAGDIPGMLRLLASEDDSEMQGQRALMRRCFGLDPAVDALPLPEPAFAWSDHGPTSSGGPEDEPAHSGTSRDG